MTVRRYSSPDFAYANGDGDFIGRLVVEEVVTADIDGVEERSLGAGARSLRDWVVAEGWEFDIPGPDGREHPVSLLRWRADDLDTTVVRVAFHGIPVSLYEGREAQGRPPFSEQP